MTSGPMPSPGRRRSGLLVLFGYTWALLHHMLGGLRHFIWDTGHGLDKPARDRLAAVNLVFPSS
jgi:succinate dehydrogenase / fumarate reductase, cytochrome b subunit